MSLVQKLAVGGQTTFRMIASSLLSMALRESPQSKRIDIAFDTYREISIKNAERSIRGQVPGVQFSDIRAAQLVKQWKKFLSEVNNKTSLIMFLLEEWKTKEYTDRLQREDKVVYVTSEKECWKISPESADEVTELFSSQEEADTRLILHTAHAAQEGYEAVVIISEDTDVFLLLLGFSASIGSNLYMKCGTKARNRLVNFQKVANSIGHEVCEALIGLHSFTGCDTTSAFAGRGQLGALKILKSDSSARQMFTELGQSWTVPDDFYTKIARFTCGLYMSSGNQSGQVNDARYELFCAKNGEVESHQLPPCQDALKKHILRANYQAGIWRRSLEAEPDIPSPDGMGWTIEVSEGVSVLQINWMDGKPAPEAVLQLLGCKCKKKCELPSCICLSSMLISDGDDDDDVDDFS